MERELGLEFIMALAFIQREYPCDRCDTGDKVAEYAVLCSNNCYHIQCLDCALHTDKERRTEAREFAWMN